MIATGLCMMGGCFAVDDSGRAVDSYWPSESVPVPSSPSSVGLYEHRSLPGMPLESCHMYTKQKMTSGSSSFFYVIQGGSVRYNSYGFKAILYFDSMVDGKNLSKSVSFPLGQLLEISASSSGISEKKLNFSQPRCDWDASAQIDRIRILDARNGEKDFYISHGQWGIKWYLLPMKSVAADSVAVFDFEQKVLVEI